MTVGRHPSRVYLDSLAGQPLAPEALSAWKIAVDQAYAAPQGHHFEAATARQFVEASLSTLSRLWQVPSSAITPVFGLSTTMRMVLSGLDSQASIALNSLSRRGIIGLVNDSGRNVTTLEVDAFGLVDHNSDADVILSQSGNHEVGTISPLRHNNTSLIVADATEWVGRMPQLPDADVTIARANCWGGLHEVCFIIDPNARLHLNERMRVTNSPDVASLVASVSALESMNLDLELVHREIVDAIRNALPEMCEAIGDPINRLPHILTILNKNVDGEALATELDRRGYSVGAASACAVESSTASHVLKALGHDSNNNIRLSLPLTISSIDDFDVARFTQALQESIESLQK